MLSAFNIPTIIALTLACLCLLSCGKKDLESEPVPDPAPAAKVVAPPQPESGSLEVAEAEAAAEAARRARFEEQLEDEIDEFYANDDASKNVDVLENPVFKQYFDELLAGQGLNDDQKKRFGQVIELLKAVDPANFDNPNRQTRLGLSGAAAERLIETKSSGNAEGLIDHLLGQVEEIAIGPIPTPTGVTSREGVILHFDEKDER
ncbi:MAG: hypothetical protein KDN20_04625 [Verrucomicrobiae bacterium]|nr:hypothetical protein [Verrucomicrobiae bacterium]